MDKSDLAERMKTYEKVSRNSLVRRIPVIIRIDGKCFHSFTKNMERPFSNELSICMQETAQYLVKNIQGCKLAYVQSDEISLLLTDYENVKTDAWVKYGIQKMTSISASMATIAFNRQWLDFELNYREDCLSGDEKSSRVETTKLAMFDSRVFNIPKDEVCNYFIWRQADATRNSIQMVGQTNFSHKELTNKNCSMIQDMLMLQKGINWNDTPTIYKRGFCVYKQKIVTNFEFTHTSMTNTGVEIGGNGVVRGKVVIDTEIPIFTQDRNFIEKWL